MVLYVVLALISIIAIVLSIKLDNTSKKNIELTVKNDELTEAITGYKRQALAVDEANKKIVDKLNNEVTNLYNTASALQQGYDDKCHLVNRLNTELQKKTDRISALETDITDLQNKNVEMQSRLLEVDPTPEAPVTGTPVAAPKEPTPVVRKPRRPRARAKKTQQ